MMGTSKGGGLHDHVSTHCYGVGSRGGNLIAGLEIEFGRGAGEGLAQHFLSAEDADFRWETRIEERWLGAYESDEDGDFWLDRVAICGRLDAKWFAAVMIIDGDGNAHGMLGCREFSSRKAAYEAMVVAH